jgi:hypothetical protein
VSPWGKRRLAYDIGRHREASYFLIHFDIEPAQVREIERGMLISEEILRHLVTVIEDRGPADEIAPAAAARSTDADDGSIDDGSIDDRYRDGDETDEPEAQMAVGTDADEADGAAARQPDEAAAVGAAEEDEAAG